MLLGTIIGVLVIPGLYYLFGQITDNSGKFIQDEDDQPLSETIEHPVPHHH
jgi:HAE1 family hydrophobic/amphiphilic exporter-1